LVSANRLLFGKDPPPNLLFFYPAWFFREKSKFAEMQIWWVCGKRPNPPQVQGCTFQTNLEKSVRSFVAKLSFVLIKRTLIFLSLYESLFNLLDSIYLPLHILFPSEIVFLTEIKGMHKGTTKDH
jgi:hypothetical protein